MVNTFKYYTLSQHVCGEIRLAPSGQNLADSVENPWGLWLLVEGIHVEIWVVSERRIHVEIQGKFFKLGLK